MPRKNQKGSHIYSCIDFFHKVLHDFEVKNSVKNSVDKINPQNCRRKKLDDEVTEN